DRFSATRCTMLSVLGWKSTEPLMLNTLIQCPASTVPSQRHVSPSRPYCCCAPSSGAAIKRAIAPTVVLFIISPVVCAAVDLYLAAEGLSGNPRPAVSDRKLHVAFPVPAHRPFAGRNRYREIRVDSATKCFDTETRAGVARNIENDRPGMGFVGVSPRGLDG